jgi:two-component system, chemotaxis family, chemotaxis protein CheY
MTPAQTVLVVDDSAVMRQMISAVLQEAGYRVLLADGGAQALAHARTSTADLVLTDWTMLPMDGGELIRQLRAMAAYARVPVVVLSTMNGAAEKSQARAAGATGWLSKPLNPDTLLEVLATLISPARSSAVSALSASPPSS